MYQSATHHSHGKVVKHNARQKNPGSSMQAWQMLSGSVGQTYVEDSEP